MAYGLSEVSLQEIRRTSSIEIQLPYELMQLGTYVLRMGSEVKFGGDMIPSM